MPLATYGLHIYNYDLLEKEIKKKYRKVEEFFLKKQVRSEQVLIDMTFSGKKDVQFPPWAEKLSPQKQESDRNVLGKLSAQNFLLHERLFQVGG